MPSRMRTRSAGRLLPESLRKGTGVRLVEYEGIKDIGKVMMIVMIDLNGQGNDRVRELIVVYRESNGKCRGANGEHPTSQLPLPNNYRTSTLHASLSIDQKVKYTAGSLVGKALTWWNSQIRTLSREVAVSMSWNDFKFMMIEEFCPSHEMQKLETELWNHAMVGAGHAAYTDSMMVAATEPKTMQKAMQISGALTDEAVRNGSIKKVEKRGNVGEPSKDKNGRDDNKRTRTGNAFAITANPVGRENTGAWLKNVNQVNVRNPAPARGVCYECGSTNHLKPACPRLNIAQGPGGKRPNQVVANNGGQGCGNQGNQARGIEPSELGFRYEIKIASRKLVEIDKVIKGCKLEIEDHVFDIDLIPFGHGSFDVIIGTDWLSNHKAKIFFHEKVVRIPLLDGKVLRVLEERLEEKARLLMSAKTSDKKQEEIVVVRDFS
ncbi:putative reverse transcriptase domain-containing protein [Tanacetum coccineum]